MCVERTVVLKPAHTQEPPQMHSKGNEASLLCDRLKPPCWTAVADHAKQLVFQSNLVFLAFREAIA